jgi:hypothetical protein
VTDKERAAKAAMWLEHLRVWRESGLSLAAYVREHQLKEWEAYGWRQILRRRGLWAQTRSESGEGSKVDTGGARQTAVRFVRVKVKDRQPRMRVGHLPMIVRVSFSNGRCAELQLLDVAQLAEVFAMLERTQ